MIASRDVDPTVRIGPGEAMAVFGLVFVAFLFLGAELQAYGLVGLIGSQLLLILAPVVGFAISKGKLVETLALGLPRAPARDLAAATLIGVSIWYVSLAVGALQQSIAPMPKEMEIELEKLLQPIVAQPLLALLALVITPAIVEEILCRAMLTRSFRAALGATGAVVVSALLFAALHLSAYRFVPQFLLGVSLGAITLASRSVLPAIWIHALHNAGLIFASDFVITHTDARVVGPLALASTVLGHAVVLRNPRPTQP